MLPFYVNFFYSVYRVTYASYWQPLVLQTFNKWQLLLIRSWKYHLPQEQASTAPPTPEIDALRSDVADLRRLVESLLHSRPHCPRSLSRSRTGSRPTSPAPSRTHASDVCWYHSKFGADATKCCAPYSYTQGNDQASHQSRPVLLANYQAVCFLSLTDLTIFVFL